MLKRQVLVFVLVFTLGGCANIPERIAQVPMGDLQLDNAVTNIEANVGQPVRWGGTVLTVADEEGQTWVEIQQHGLDQYGSPRMRENSKGRFLVRMQQLAGELSIGRKVTVFGTLGGSYDGSIGHEPYQFPVVNAEEHYLWEPDYTTAYPRYFDDYFRYPHRYNFGSYPYLAHDYTYSYTNRYPGFYSRYYYW